MRPTKRPSKRRRSQREIARQADRILVEAAAKARQFESQGLRYVTLPRAELIRKLSGRTTHSPFLAGIGWGSAVRGMTFPLNFGIMNPDPYPYEEANLGLCVYWGPATGVAQPGESLLAADKAAGIMAVNLGILNPSTTPYYVSASHLIPTALAGGGNRSDLSYLLYTVNAFQLGVVLERGSLSIAIA